MKSKLIAVLVCSMAVGVQAQVLDLQNGRTADVMNEPQFSAEAGLVSGDIDYLGVRGNLKVADNILLMGDIGQADGNETETSAAVSGMMQLPVDLPISVALKLGYAMLLSGDTDASDIGLDVIGSAVITDVIGWYVNVGVHRGDIEETYFGETYEDDEVLPVVGGGLVFTINQNASAFVGVDILMGDTFDDTVFGGGVRWGF